MTIHSITQFLVQVILVFVHGLFCVFLSLPLWFHQPPNQSNTFFSPNHHHPSLGRLYHRSQFICTTLLCLLFLTAALIQRRIVYTLVSHHISDQGSHSHFCLMTVYILF